MKEPWPKSLAETRGLEADSSPFEQQRTEVKTCHLASSSVDHGTML